MLSLFITFYANSNSMNPTPIKIAVLFVTVGCFVSRLLVVRFGIKAPTFMQRL